MIRFACPRCGIQLSAPRDCAGRSSKCRACGQPVTVPTGKSELHDADVRYPAVENAADNITSLRVLPYSEYVRLSFEARRDCFTVPGVESAETIVKIKAIVFDCFKKGEYFRDFKTKIKNAFGNRLELSDMDLEKVFRRTLMKAYTEGMLKTLEHPLVGSGFPYLSFSAIHDGRTPRTHIALEQYGLNGTNIYRRDDPFWRLFMPPLTDLCRCTVCAMTPRQAARKGVREAQEWLRTGQPPERPQWVEPPHFDPRLELEDEDQGWAFEVTPQGILQDVLALRDGLIKQMEKFGSGPHGGRLPRKVLVAPKTSEEGLALLQGRKSPVYTPPPLEEYFLALEEILENIPSWKGEPENDREYLATIETIIACCRNAGEHVGMDRKAVFPRSACSSRIPSIIDERRQLRNKHPVRSSPMIQFRCPACDQTHELADNLAGTKGPCPSCGQRLQFPFPIPLQVVEKPTPTANEPIVIEVSAKLLVWPRSCACCMGPADTALRVTATREKRNKPEARSWNVPYCSSCLAHIRTQSGAKADCCTMGQAVVYDRWHGTVHSFRFLSRAYADAFREANAKKVLG